MDVFCNRTLNFKSIKAIGYDMDYTLINYYPERWESRAYEHLKHHFLAKGWPVEHLKFDPHLACRGLIIDQEKGNLLKVNRFGFIKQAMHGTTFLSLEKQKALYARTIVDLSEKRWSFLNTLFSLSEGCIYAQLVDLLDAKKIPETLGYMDLYQIVLQVLEAAHMEGELKREIISDPDRFVKLDPQIPLTLLDQMYSGKKLMLITNSEWEYVNPMMEFSFHKFLPASFQWHNLFDLIIISARKPFFFTSSQPIFQIINQHGHLKPTLGKLQKGICYLGGSATQVEESLGVSGDEILYVGDHLFADVHVTKNILRWRTALILRELEAEREDALEFAKEEEKLLSLMKQKQALESALWQARLHLQRHQFQYGPPCLESKELLENKILQIRSDLDALDLQITPLAQASAKLHNPRWGPLMRTGNDKSHFAYQMEKYADIYTSSVSKLMETTPFCYLRSQRGYLPHEVES